MKKVTAGLIIYLFFSSMVYAINFGDVVPSSSVNTGKDCTKAVSPNTITQGSPGNIEWVNVNNAVNEDDKEASVDNHSKNHIKDAAARLILADGSIGSIDKSNGNNWTEISQYVTYGGDTWKANFTPQDINNANFGFTIQIGGGIADSYFLKATNFGFHIPSTSTVTGITVEVKRREAPRPGSEGTMGYVDNIRMSVCYTPNNIFPPVFAVVADLEKIRVAPGELLPIPMTLEPISAGTMPDATMQFQIRGNGSVIINETEPVKSLSTTSPVKTIQIPKNLIPGVYEATGTFLYGAQTVPDVIKFQFTVENKIAGIFMSQFIAYACVLLLLCIGLFITSRFFTITRKKVVTSDYADIPEPNRVYYEMIGDMVTQMHDSIGDKAYEMVDAISGLSIDKTTGKIIDIKKDPSEVMSVLYIKYQNLFKKKLKITARSKNKKVVDDANSVKKSLDTLEKYFNRK